jgi:hypothetical protein
VWYHQSEGSGDAERPEELRLQRSKLLLKPGSLVPLAREAVAPCVLDDELADSVARDQVHRLLLALAPVRSVNDLDRTCGCQKVGRGC